MLLQLENTSKDNLKKMIDYAHQLNLNLNLIDEYSDNPALQGGPFSPDELRALIEKSKAGKSIDMETAHNIIRKRFTIA